MTFCCHSNEFALFWHLSAWAVVLLLVFVVHLSTGSLSLYPSDMPDASCWWPVFWRISIGSVVNYMFGICFWSGQCLIGRWRAQVCGLHVCVSVWVVQNIGIVCVWSLCLCVCVWSININRMLQHLKIKSNRVFSLCVWQVLTGLNSLLTIIFFCG